jgi:glucose-6-phosphate isomerase
MPLKSIDVTPVMIKKMAKAIREADDLKEAVKLLLNFCEYYRKNYTARRARLVYLPGKNITACKKWYSAHKEESNMKRRIDYRKESEKKWREGLLKRKPRCLK